MASREFFTAAYDDAPPPWDIGRPQRDLVRAFDELALSGSAVDLGCGTGEHTLELARRGIDAWGLDSTPSAIAAAERKCRERALSAQFVVGDALELATLDRKFDLVLDCGLFHVIAEQERLRYVRELDHVLALGGRFLMLGFATNTRGRGPRGYSELELRSYFGGTFREIFVRAATFEVRPETGLPDGVPAWLSLFEATGPER